MQSKGHDTLVYRLSEILVRLNQGEHLNPKELASDFGVNLRTIQRDLNVRLAYLPIEKFQGLYSLPASYLGKFGLEDIRHFAGLAGVSQLFPSLDNDFLRSIFDDKVGSSLLVKGHNYEDLSGKECLFHKLESTIENANYIAFEYETNKGVKAYDQVSPYKLVNNKGIWYLAGVHEGKLKTFAFTRIDSIVESVTSFEADPTTLQRLLDEDSIWFTAKRTTVRLKANPEIARYFKRRKLIANQVIESEADDGSVIIRTEVGHQNQILPIVRYWMPHLLIQEPMHMQEALNESIESYLANHQLSSDSGVSL